MNTTQRNNWDALSMKEKAAMMKVAVQNGIYNLNDIRQAYNEFAEGGPQSVEDNIKIYPKSNEYKEGGDTNNVINNIKNKAISKYVKDAASNLSLEEVRNRLYRNIYPHGYNDYKSRLINAVKYNKREGRDLTGDRYNSPRLPIWATYLNIPIEDRDDNIYGKELEISEYKPTQASDTSIYYKIPGQLSQEQISELIQDANGQYKAGIRGSVNDKYEWHNASETEKDLKKRIEIGQNKLSTVLGKYFGTHTLGRGYDNKGEYVSFYDLWDVAPVKGIGEDESEGVGNPINFYDRIYLDDYYEIPENKRGSYFLPEVTVTPQKSLGGPLVESANKYDGTTEESQQMDTADLSSSRNAWYSDFERRNGRKPTWWDNYKRNLYNLVNPAEGYPTGLFDTISKGITGLAAFLAPNSVKVRRGNNIEPVSEAAWAKRLDMPYDESLVVDNGDNTYRLPKQYEQEIPIDTTMLKKRIEDNQRLADSPDVMGEQWRILNKYIEADKNALDSLRYTYATGEPVVINEFSYNSRKAMDENGNIVPVTSPLNVLQNYTIQYNKDDNSMDYRDIYDFNWFEPFVPGKPFRIQGSIPLKK